MYPLIRKRAMVWLCCWMCWLGATAQNAYLLTLQIDPADAPLCRDLIGPQQKPHFSDSTHLVFSLKNRTVLDSFCLNLVRIFRENTRLGASIDSLRSDSLAANAQLFVGPPMRWVQLRTLPTDADWLGAVRFHPLDFTDKPLNHTALLLLEKRLLESAENNGYPFARIWLDSIDIQPGGAVSALLRMDKKRFVVYKDVRIRGDVRLPNGFLPNYLGLKPGKPYSRAAVMQVRDRLRALQFVEASGNPSVSFAGNEATLNLALQKKRVSRFDFIIGLLPQTNENSGLLVTGNLNAVFLNALNQGERLSLEFERLRPETQKLDFQASVPYMLGTAFGLDGRLNIFRRDSTWVDALGDVGVQYLLEAGNFVRFFWENRSSSLQKIDEAALLATRQLPATLDFRQTGFGLETGFNRLDYRFNPRRGWAAGLKAVAGYNTLRRNNLIEQLTDPNDPAFRFSSLYDSLPERAARYRLEGRAEYFIPVFQRSTIRMLLRGSGIFSEKPVYQNEQYRLGGNKLQRGFDEESLFATRFAVATLEYRLLLGQNSYLSAFTDYGYIENSTTRLRTFQRPWGFGVGMNFETRAGIFGISIAVGRPDTGLPVDFRATKFHLGYIL